MAGAKGIGHSSGMIRNLEGLSARLHDVLVIGGGITGSCIARDAALRGLSVALIEAHDFSHATSSATTKLVHGGLRYLRTFELGLVRESLAERRRWEIIAPHMVRPVPFLLPVPAHEALTLHLGLTLYDILSFDRNRVPFPDQRMPAHRWLAGREMIGREPVLASFGASGAMLYYDCQMYAPERLGLECLLDAARAGANIANYAEAVALAPNPDGAHAVEARDSLSGRRHIVRARTIVNASGPWADGLAARLVGDRNGARLIRSKGIHVLTRALTRTHALALPTKGGGHLFIIPWRGFSLIGTTDTPFEGDPATLSISREEIRALLATVNATLPGARLTDDDVVHAYAGLRPLVADGRTGSTYAASRRGEIVDHGALSGVPNVFSALGGKWTTSRHVAEKVVDRLLAALGRSPIPATTAGQPLPGGRMSSLSALAEDLARVTALAPESCALLAQLYGALAQDVIAHLAAVPDLAAPLAPGRGEIAAQIVHAVEAEMAQTLEDVVFRRTGLGTNGDPGVDALRRAASLMAPKLGWDPTEIERQIEATRAKFPIPKRVLEAAR